MENMIDKELLKNLRSQKNWSQDELATASGLSHRTIQRIESSGNCSLESKRALCAALDIEPSKLNVPEPKSASNMRAVKCINYIRAVSALLFIPLLVVVATLVIRNYQSTAQFEVIISNPNDVSGNTFNIALGENSTKVIKLRNGYSLEVDYAYGVTPRLKAQLYQLDESGKRLLHTSDRFSVKFHPVKYVINSDKSVTYISPNRDLAFTGSST